MIQQNEHILYICQAKCAVTAKQTESMKTGMLEKKIVITTRRCLFFESLTNMVAEIEYEVLVKKKKLEDATKNVSQVRRRVSINELPEHWFGVNQRESRVMISEEPKCINYLHKIGLMNLIKRVTGIVIMKNLSKMKFELLQFPDLKDGFRFCRAIECAKSWLRYEAYCEQHRVPVNRQWARIVTEVVNNEKCVVLIDPELFLTGSPEEIKSFYCLINELKYARSFQHRYSITTPEISTYALQFIEMFQQKTHSLILSNTQMTINTMNLVFSTRLKLEHIMHLSLSHNKLTDQVFIVLQRLGKEGKRLSYFDLSHNCITLANGTLLVNFLKATQIMLKIDLSYNEIGDNCVETIEKFVIMPPNPPLEQFNISYNKLCKRSAWRLFIGNAKYSKYHPTLNFILYPIPVKTETFPKEQLVEYPKPGQLINFNMHSALVEEFEQESFMRHTLLDIVPSEMLTMKFIRRFPSNLKLPNSKEQVHRTLQLSNRIENFIYLPQFVESMHDLADEIEAFEYNLSPVTRSRFVKYLADKLNEALFIRDHYSVKFILKALKCMGVDYEGYRPRINKVAMRNEIVKKKMEDIVNFEMDECDINRQLDEIVKEGLRLYLTGNGIEGIYYLKFLRDKWVEKLISEQHNPEHFINDRMNDKNMILDDEVSEKQLVIPYEIRVEKKINENFYLHPWKTNYYALSQIVKAQFEQCLVFLQQSTKREKFAAYFSRIEERIEFMKNQFVLFSYNRFKVSYSDLKINCARLLAMYNFITDKVYYLDIAPVARKVPVIKEKKVTISNPVEYKNEYNMSRYPNINKYARGANFWGYKNKMTKYSSEAFTQEFIQLKNYMDNFYKILEKQAKLNPEKIPEELCKYLIEIIKYIRRSIYPEQLKEEFYLRLLSWRGGRHVNNKELMMYIPFLSMYLRPPLMLEKYIVASILSNPDLNIGDLPMSIVCDPNKSSELNLNELARNYVDRDWMASEKTMIHLMKTSGKIPIEIKLLVKRKEQFETSESRTVQDLVNQLITIFSDIEDVSHFWVYMGYAGETNLTVLENSQHIGEIICEKEEKEKYFVFKRRIFCPEWKYIYKKYSEAIIDSLYYDLKYEYLLGEFFVNDEEMTDLAAQMFIIDTKDEVPPKKNFNDFIIEKVRSLGNYYKGYMPEQAIARSLKPPGELINEMRDKVNEKIMKKQHLKTLQIKKEIMHTFENYPEFLCSNYIFTDKNKKKLKVSINWLNVIVNSIEMIEKFNLEKIISIIPKSKFLLINYHKHEGIIGKVNLYGQENKILSTAQDILTYCMMRVKMLGNSLYSACRYELLMDKYVKVEQPTDDKEILESIRRIKKKLSGATPTILEHGVIIYFEANRYVKMNPLRKLYANASLEELKIEENQEDGEDLDAQDYNDHNNGPHNVLKVIFPKGKDEEEPKVIKKNKVADDSDLSLSRIDPKAVSQLDPEVPLSIVRSQSEQPPDPMSSYDSIDIKFKMDNDPEPHKPLPKIEEDEPIEEPKQSKISNDPVDMPPELMEIKKPENKQPAGESTPAKEPNEGLDQFEKITTAKRNKQRLPRRKNV